MQNDKAINVSNLAVSVNQGRKTLLSGVNFSVASGQFIAVIGASGCGKSTLIKTLAGLMLPSHGHVLFAGHPVAEIKEQFPLAVGYLPQFGAFHADLTVEENLLNAMSLRLPRSVSAAWWDEPKEAVAMPPGIVACGAKEDRLGASLLYFKQGRAVGKPWLWIEVANTGHRMNDKLDEFVRDYLAVLLKGKQPVDPQRNGIWLDVDRLEEIPKDGEHPALTGWLPERKLFKAWRDLNRNDD